MGGVNSIAAMGGASYAAALAGVRPQGVYDANASAYGPAVASVIGLASATGDATGTVCSFSTESLERLGDAVGAAISSAGSAIGDAVHEVRQGVTDLADGITSLVQGGADAIEEAGDAIGTKVGSVVHGVESSVASAATSVGDAVASVASGIGASASQAASYLALGAAAGVQMLNEVA